MIDLFTVLLVAFVILLIIQIVALVRIRLMIVRLKSILNVIAPIVQRTQDIQRTKLINMRMCQFCKYRQTFIKATSEAEDEFYYRCKITDRNVNLTDTCPHFEVEPEI